MKLLLITQRIDANDRNLAVHVRWLHEMSKHVERIYVIAQSVGLADLPENVEVVSLGKENGASKFSQFIRLMGALQSGVAKSEAVFVLMVPLYVLLAAPFAWISRKKIYLWYTHKHVSRVLRLAEKCVRLIFSASKESFRLETPKVQFVGHAIDTEFFSPAQSVVRIPGKVVSVSRLSKSKRIELFVQVVGELGGGAVLDIIGDPIQPEDFEYVTKLKAEVESKGWSDRIRFLGGKSPEEVREAYRSAAAFVNASETGSLDKAVLEAMSCECPVFVSNESFKEIVPAPHFLSASTAQVFTEALQPWLSGPKNVPALRDIVVNHHNIKQTLARVIAQIEATK